jgi:2Fe-2S ferredoxin
MMLDGVAAERRPTSRLSCQLNVPAGVDDVTLRTPDRQT